MAQNINQFAQTQVLGQLDLEFNGSVVSMQVSANQATALVAGQPIMVENSAGGAPKVLALASNTDTTNGFVVRNLKDPNFPTYARLEVAMEGSVMYLNSGAAINRFGPVEAVQGTPGNVIAWAGVNPVVGFAFDQATGANQLVRIFIKPPTPNGAANVVKTVNVTATLAQINAGLVLVPGATGKKVTVTNVVQRVLGNFATGTSVNLQSDATSVIVESSAEAALTTGSVLTSAPTANVTLGAGFATPLPTGEGLKVVNIGAAQTAGTSIQFTVSYTQG